MNRVNRDNKNAEVLKVAEVASALKVAPTTISRAVRRGEIPAICTGSRIIRIPTWWLIEKLAPPKRD